MRRRTIFSYRTREIKKNHIMAVVTVEEETDFQEIAEEIRKAIQKLNRQRENDTSYEIFCNIRKI